MSTRSTSIFMDPNVAKHLSLLHDKYVIVPADKAPKDIVCVYKSHYIDCLIKELGIHNSLGNPTYTPTTLTKEEILDNHRSVLCSFQTTLYCWVCQIFNETSFLIISMYSIGGNSTVTLATREVVCIRCGF
jgi:hypothetical protein